MIVDKERLLTLLRDMLKSVEDDDSFEGNLGYSCLEAGLERGQFEVSCAFRVGNAMGQGGAVVVPATETSDAPTP